MFFCARAIVAGEKSMEFQTVVSVGSFKSLPTVFSSHPQTPREREESSKGGISNVNQTNVFFFKEEAVENVSMATFLVPVKSGLPPFWADVHTNCILSILTTSCLY